MHVVSFFVHVDARTAAAILRRARKFLRDKVDESNPVALEVAALKKCTSAHSG